MMLTTNLKELGKEIMQIEQWIIELRDVINDAHEDIEDLTALIQASYKKGDLSAVEMAEELIESNRKLIEKSRNNIVDLKEELKISEQLLYTKTMLIF